ncbi:MAG: hypothetical protein ACTSRP_21810 [Candidatus Helarchaeota archaeon]
MNNNENKKEKLEDIISKLEKSNRDSEYWKKIVENNKEYFQQIKSKIKIKQDELKELVIQKQVGKIPETQFNEKLEKIQDELTELEFKIYKMRLDGLRNVNDE